MAIKIIINKTEPRRCSILDLGPKDFFTYEGVLHQVLGKKGRYGYLGRNSEVFVVDWGAEGADAIYAFTRTLLVTPVDVTITIEEKS